MLHPTSLVFSNQIIALSNTEAVNLNLSEFKFTGNSAGVSEHRRDMHKIN